MDPSTGRLYACLCVTQFVLLLSVIASFVLIQFSALVESLLAQNLFEWKTNRVE